MSGAVIIPVDAGARGALNLVFKFGTIRKAEQEMGAPLTTAMAQGQLGFDVISAVFWAALQPSLMITRDGSDDLIDELGVGPVAEKVAEGLTRYFGGSKAEGAAGEEKAAKKGK